MSQKRSHHIAPGNSTIQRTRRPTKSTIIFIIIEVLTLIIALIGMHNAYHRGRQDGAADQSQTVTAQLQNLATAVRTKSTYVDQISRLTQGVAAELDQSALSQYITNLDQLLSDLSADDDLPADLKSQAQTVLETYRAACQTFQQALESNQQDDQAFATLQEAAATAGQQLTDLFNQAIHSAAQQLEAAE